MVAAQTHNDTALIVGAFIVVPMFLTAGILMIRRPAQMYHRFWIWSEKPPLKFDLVCCQVMGWIFTVGIAAWAIGFASYLISN